MLIARSRADSVAAMAYTLTLFDKAGEMIGQATAESRDEITTCLRTVTQLAVRCTARELSGGPLVVYTRNLHGWELEPSG